MDSDNKLLGFRSQLARKLPQFREMLPGSLIVRQLTCGKANCACMLKGHKHTAYQLTYRLDGKTVSRMIPKHQLDDVRQRVDMQHEFAEHVRKIQKINVQLLEERLNRKK